MSKIKLSPDNFFLSGELLEEFSFFFHIDCTHFYRNKFFDERIGRPYPCERTLKYTNYGNFLKLYLITHI